MTKSHRKICPTLQTGLASLVVFEGYLLRPLELVVNETEDEVEIQTQGDITKNCSKKPKLSVIEEGTEDLAEELTEDIDESSPKQNKGEHSK